MVDLLGLEDKKVLVFGGTRKIGKAIALRFAAAGAEVTVTGRDAETGVSMCREIEDLGGRSHFAQCNITAYDSITAAVRQSTDLMGHIDVAVPSASGRTKDTQGFRPFAEIGPEEILGYANTSGSDGQPMESSHLAMPFHLLHHSANSRILLMCFVAHSN